MIVNPLKIRIRSMSKKQKPIFQIGFNKAGSSSLHQFLVESGIESVHWDAGTLARKMTKRMQSGQNPIADYPGVTAFTDMYHIDDHNLFEPFKNFQYLEQWFPQACFILNTRPKEKWIKSRKTHIAPILFGHDRESLLLRNEIYFGLSADEVEVYWSKDWDVHLANVRAYFKGSDRLLEIDIEKSDETEERLTAFLTRHLGKTDWSKWPHANKTSRNPRVVPKSIDES